MHAINNRHVQGPSPQTAFYRMARDTVADAAIVADSVAFCSFRLSDTLIDGVETAKRIVKFSPFDSRAIPVFPPHALTRNSDRVTLNISVSDGET